MQLLHELIERVAATAPDTPYFHYQGETFTYGRTQEISQRLARALAGAGVRPGDRVAVMISNRPELIPCYFACWKLGAIIVPLNTRYQRREAAHALEHSGSVAFICESRYFPIVEPLCRKDHLHDHTVLIDAKLNGLTDFPDWEDFLAGAPEEIEWPEVTLETPTNFMYTSGSTAMPKGVLHCHRTFWEMARILNEYMVSPQIGTGGALLPACYIGALLYLVMNAAYMGKDFVLIHDKNIDEFLAAVPKYQITYTVLLPTDLINLLEHPKFRETDWSSLLWVGAGGDKVPVDAQHDFQEVTGLEVTEIYGMSEFGHVIGNEPYGPKHYGTMGKEVAGVSCELRADDGKTLVPDGEIGNLWVKSPAHMLEYWNNPQATRETIVDDWLNTGDQATRDAEGYYSFVGRSKLIIVHGGSNISPQQVEEVIDHHPAVSSCCVVGVPDRKYGETVMAWVVLHGYPGAPPTPDDIILYARQRIAHYKCPERVVFLEKMPYTPSGKMDRQGLKRRAAEEFGNA
ncbi:MAG: class I adenylate-forming enzyme family protein [Verrucomicrobiota bacterium]